MDPLIEEEITEPIYEPISVADDESDYINQESIQKGRGAPKI